MADGTLPETDFFEKHGHKIEFGDPGGCWLWTAGKFDTGYGRIKARGKNRYTHRLSYEAEHGAGSADGLVVRHKCDVRACVNPDHLEIGTKTDNNRDRDERGRQAKGEANGCAKLTEDDVRTIRAEYVRGSDTHGTYALARRFGVFNTLIGMIVRRERWTHI